MFSRLAPLFVLFSSSIALAADPVPPAESSESTPRAAAPSSPAVSAAFGKGVTVANEAGNLSLNVRARIQARFTETVSDTHAEEFLIRRMRLSLRGKFFSNQLEYNVQLGFANADTEPDLRLPLRDAYVTWSPKEWFSLRFGQMKVAYARQRRTSSGTLQFADRSVATAELNLDRDVGVVAMLGDLPLGPSTLSADVGVYGGDGRNRTSTAAGVLVTGRLTWKPFGKFDDLPEADLERSARPRLAIGLGAAHNANSNRERSTFGGVYEDARFDTLHLGADVSLRWHGVSLVAEWLRRDMERSTPEGGTESPRSAEGWYAQAGWLFLPKFEVVARYGELRPRGTDSAVERQHELGGGLNWYLQGHDFKVQLDAFRLYERSIDDGKTQVRLQTQVWF